MTRFNKFWTALVAAAGVAAATLGDGDFSSNDVIAIVAAFIGAVGVYAVPNKPPGTP